MSYAKLFRADPVRTLAAGSVVVGYTAIGTLFEHPTRQIFIQNLTDALLMFSFDADNDHFPLLPQSFLILDVTSNEVDPNGWFIGKSTIMYVKRIGTPTTGSVYLSVFYGKGD